MKTERSKIQFEWDGKLITREFTADSLRKMEARGFDISKVEERLLTLGETLFVGAFIANHDDIKESKRRELYKEISAVSEGEQAEGIDDALAGMLREAIEEMQSHRGNLKWKVTT